MFLFWPILSAIYLDKALWDKVIRTIEYLKNLYFDINVTMYYELDNHFCPDFSPLKLVDFQAWI